jgi:cytochrome c
MRHFSALLWSTACVFATATAALAQYNPFPGWSVLEAEQAAGRQISSNHCAACHATKPGARAIHGPTLEGVLGRPAASVAEFPYSDALKKSGIIWSEDNLRRWIADSARMVPNTLMPHVSISDPAEQIYLVAYLKTLKARPAR